MDIKPGRAQPPLGYLCIGQGDARRFVPDPERATLIMAEFGGGCRRNALSTSIEIGSGGRADGTVGLPDQHLGPAARPAQPRVHRLLRYGQEPYAEKLESLVGETTFKEAVLTLGRQTEAFHTKRLSCMEMFHNIMTEARTIKKDRLLQN